MSTEFVKQTLRENLGRVVIPHVADGLWSIYDNAKVACERNQQVDKTLQTFQNLLTRIPQWNEETLEKEVERISIASKCDYIEDLLLGVFVSYIRAFASLQQVDHSHVEVPFTRPPLSKFIHTLYISSARKSWSNAFLFKTIGVSSEQQARNRRDIEAMLEQSLNEVIDGFIPWKDISKAYFQAKQEVHDHGHSHSHTSTPSKPVRFGESEVQEFETEDEEEEEEEEDHPKLKVGEEIKLDFDDDASSVNTEDEIERKATETVSLNL